MLSKNDNIILPISLYPFPACNCVEAGNVGGFSIPLLSRWHVSPCVLVAILGSKVFHKIWKARILMLFLYIYITLSNIPNLLQFSHIPPISCKVQLLVSVLYPKLVHQLYFTHSSWQSNSLAADLSLDTKNHPKLQPYNKFKVLHPRQTMMTMEKYASEDVSPIENGDFPLTS